MCRATIAHTMRSHAGGFAMKNASTHCCAIALALALAWPTPRASAQSCSAQRGFELGHAGVTALDACGGTDGFMESWQLGMELAGLERERTEQAALAEQASGEAANRHARRVRHLEVDIEAIRGALLLRGIVIDGPSAEAAGAEAARRPGNAS
jgi:hypothetical protein